MAGRRKCARVYFVRIEITHLRDFRIMQSFIQGYARDTATGIACTGTILRAFPANIGRDFILLTLLLARLLLSIRIQSTAYHSIF